MKLAPEHPHPTQTADPAAIERDDTLTSQIGTIVGQYKHDGRGRRIVKETYSGGTLSETRHFYYSSAWQDLEERVGTSTAPDRQWVWGLRYVDELICWDRDTDADGTLDERMYSLQDANFNVTDRDTGTQLVYERRRGLSAVGPEPRLPRCTWAGCPCHTASDPRHMDEPPILRASVAID